jgi:odorant receptor
MDGFYQIALRCMAGIGLNFGHYKDWSTQTWIKVIMYINLLVVASTLLQEFVFLVDSRNLTVQRLCVVPCILNVGEAAFKYINGIYHGKEIKRVMNSLDEIYDKMNREEKSRFKVFSFKLRRIAIFFGSTNMIVIWLFNLLPIILMLNNYFSSGIWVFLYPFFFWWPFKSTDYFISTYLYQVYCGQIATFQMLILDVLYMMIVSQIVTHYRHLGESFNNFITSASESKENMQEYNKKFRYLVEIQIKLNSNCDSINKIYGLPHLVHVCFATLIICFTGLLAVTQSELSVLIQFGSVLVISLIHTFFLCWFGDKIEEEVK